MYSSRADPGFADLLVVRNPRCRRRRAFDDVTQELDTKRVLSIAIECRLRFRLERGVACGGVQLSRERLIVQPQAQSVTGRVRDARSGPARRA